LMRQPPFRLIDNGLATSYIVLFSFYSLKNL
jgi:hypothetical protein